MSGYNKEDSINLENKCIKEIRRYETKLEWDKACQLYEKQFLKFEALEYISSDQLLNVIDFCLCLFNLARINRKVSISCLYRCQDLLNKLDEIIAKNNSSEQDYSRNLLWKLAKTLHFFFGALWTQLLYKDENSTLTLMHLIQDLNNEVEQALHNEVALDGRTKHVLGIGLLCLGEFAYRLFTVSERKVDLTRCSIGLKSLSLSEELLSKKRPNALLIYLKLLKIYIKLSYEIGYEVMEEKEKLMQKFKEVKREFNSIQKIAFRVNDFCKGIALLIKGWITYIR